MNILKTTLLMCIAFTSVLHADNPTYIHDWHQNKHGVGIVQGGIGCADSICIQASHTSVSNLGEKQGFNLHTQLPQDGGNLSYNSGSWTNDVDEKDPILQDDLSRYVGQQQPDVTINYHGNANAILGTGKATYEGQYDASGVEKLTVQGAPTGVYTFQGQGQYRADESINGYLPNNDPDYDHQFPNGPIDTVLEYGTNRHGFFKEVQQSGSYAPVDYTLGEGEISGTTKLTFEANTGGPHSKYASLGLNLGVVHSSGFNEELTRQVQSGSWWDKMDTDVIAAVAKGNAVLVIANTSTLMNELQASDHTRGILRCSAESLSCSKEVGTGVVKIGTKIGLETANFTANGVVLTVRSLFTNNREERLEEQGYSPEQARIIAGQERDKIADDFFAGLNAGQELIDGIDILKPTSQTQETIAVGGESVGYFIAGKGLIKLLTKKPNIDMLENNNLNKALDNKIATNGMVRIEGKDFFREIEIVDFRGSPIGEFDEIDLKKRIFFEDKSAQGLSAVNPRTGLPTQTAQEFTDKQLVNKTRVRINNLRNSAANTRPTVQGTVVAPNLDEIKGIRSFTYRLDGDTPELRRATAKSLGELKVEFPDYEFDAVFGVGR